MSDMVTMRSCNMQILNCTDLPYKVPYVFRDTIIQLTSDQLCFTVIISLCHRKFVGRIPGVAKVLINLFKRFRCGTATEFQQPLLSGHKTLIRNNGEKGVTAKVIVTISITHQ